MEQAWCDEAVMLKATSPKQIMYMILYASSVGGPLLRRLEASMITHTRYKIAGIKEKRVRRKYTRDGVETRFTRDPDEYLIVQ